MVVFVACTGSPGGEQAFGAERIAAGRAAAERVRALLEAYYGGPEVLLHTWALSPEAPERAAGRLFLADKIARALVWEEPFVIGAVGSSVTSGTDNCAYDTYPAQLERLLAPVFAAAGTRLEVRNAGQGGFCGDSYKNQIWCLRALVGDDVDVVHYSWTYFEAGDPNPAIHHEMFYRWALAMERAPVPQLLYTGSCKRLLETDAKLLDRYGAFGVNILCMTRGIERAGYPGQQGGVVGDTLHDTTRYGEDPALSEERRRSLGVVFRNWHPGPLLFQTTADALAYHYAGAFLQALGELAATPNPAARWPREPTRASLPEPLACDPALCSVEAPPSCLYYEEPRFGSPQVSLEGEARHPETGLPLAPAPGWRFHRFANGHSMPEAERALAECRPSAYCAGHRAEPDTPADWLRFRLPPLERGWIELCCASKECGQRLLDAGAEFVVDGEPVVAPEAKGKCLVLKAGSEGTWNPIRSGHSVEVRLPASPEPPPAITHVYGL